MADPTSEDLVSMELQLIAKEIDARLKKVAGKRMNFSLVVYGSQIGTRMSYVSNVERDSVKQAFTSLLKGWEDDMPDIPAHLIN